MQDFKTILNNNNINTNNDNESYTNLNNNDIDNVNVISKASRATQVELIADKLVDKFNAPNWRVFYCKVAWRLPEAFIWRNYELAQKGNNKGAYFNYLCNVDMQRQSK